MFDHMDNSEVRLCRKHIENDGKGKRKPVKDLCRRSWWESGGDSEVLVGERSYVGTGRDSWWSSLEGSRILVELLVEFLGESGILVEKRSPGGAPRWSLHGA